MLFEKNAIIGSSYKHMVTKENIPCFHFPWDIGAELIYALQTKQFKFKSKKIRITRLIIKLVHSENAELEIKQKLFLDFINAQKTKQNSVFKPKKIAFSFQQDCKIPMGAKTSSYFTLIYSN